MRPSARARPELFLWTCIVYFTAGIAIVIGGRSLLPNLRATTFVHAMVDALAISLLMFSSGGVASGLGILFVVPVGAMALLADSRDTFLLAALAALALLMQQVGGHVTHTASILPTTPPPASWVASCSWWRCWPGRWRAACATPKPRVRRQQVDLANLAQLSQYIVQHLRESIVVIDHENRIRLINESAAKLLGDSRAYPGALLGEASPQLLYLLETWRPRTTPPAAPSHTFVVRRWRPRHPAAFRLARRRRAGSRSSSSSRTPSCWPPRSSSPSSRAWDGCRPASRTRSATRSGAMSHAAQLLAESPSLSDEDKRLTEIVRTNGDRVRQIIENVMSMARRENSRPERLILAHLAGGLPRRVLRHHADRAGAPGHFLAAGRRGGPGGSFAVAPDRLEPVRKRGQVRRDEQPATMPIELRVGRLASTARPFLEVADRGPGIACSIASGSSSPSSPATNAARDSACSWRANWRRPTAPHSCTSRAPAAAACSVSCSGIPNAGWHDAR